MRRSPTCVSAIPDGLLVQVREMADAASRWVYNGSPRYDPADPEDRRDEEMIRHMNSCCDCKNNAAFMATRNKIQQLGIVSAQPL